MDADVNRHEGTSRAQGLPDGGCIYPGCERPAVGPDERGGPPSAFCDREDHNALTAHQERMRLQQEEERG
jgi:hypothetical protein